MLLLCQHFQLCALLKWNDAMIIRLFGIDLLQYTQCVRVCAVAVVIFIDDDDAIFVVYFQHNTFIAIF